jgi:hypothetical protein
MQTLDAQVSSAASISRRRCIHFLKWKQRQGKNAARLTTYMMDPNNFGLCEYVFREYIPVFNFFHSLASGAWNSQCYYTMWNLGSRTIHVIITHPGAIIQFQH